MSSAIETDMSVITYDINDSQIADMRMKYTGLVIKDKNGYEVVRRAIADCRDNRGVLEKRRKELKDGALKFGQKVDEIARNYRVQIEKIEEGLQAEKDRVDNEEKDRLKAIEDARLAEIAAQEKARKDAEEADLKRQRDELEDQRQKLAADQKAAQDKIDAQNKIIEEENRKIKDAKELADRQEFQRQATLKAEKDAADKIERDRIAAEEKATMDAEIARLKAEREEAQRPDVEKIHRLSDYFNRCPWPAVKDEECYDFMQIIADKNQEIIELIENFKP